LVPVVNSLTKLPIPPFEMDVVIGGVKMGTMTFYDINITSVYINTEEVKVSFKNNSVVI